MFVNQGNWFGYFTRGADQDAVRGEGGAHRGERTIDRGLAALFEQAEQIARPVDIGLARQSQSFDGYTRQGQIIRSGRVENAVDKGDFQPIYGAIGGGFIARVKQGGGWRVGASARAGRAAQAETAPGPSQRMGGGYTGLLHRYENSELMEQPDVQAQLVLVMAAAGHTKAEVRKSEGAGTAAEAIAAPAASASAASARPRPIASGPRAWRATASGWGAAV